MNARVYHKEFAKAKQLYRLGEVTPIEVAHLAGVSRQLAAHWAVMAEIDWQETRAKRLRRLWRSATDQITGARR